MSKQVHRKYIRLTINDAFRYYPEETPKQTLVDAEHDLASKVVVFGFAVFDLGVSDVYATELYASLADISDEVTQIVEKESKPSAMKPASRESKIKKPKG